MLPPAADPSAPDSGVAKRSGSDDDDPTAGAASPQGHQDTSKGTQTAVVPGKGKDTDAQDHDDDSVAPHGAKKLKQQEGEGHGIDINKALHHDDGLASPPAGGGGKGSSPAPHRPLSLEIKKRELEIDAEMLELERQRMRWADASRRKDMELEEMRLENDRMKLDNERLWVQLKRGERELECQVEEGLGHVYVMLQWLFRSWTSGPSGDGAAEMKGKTKLVL